MNHRATNRNIMDGIDELMRGEVADISLVDPPWGEGNEKYWHTMLAKVDPLTSIKRPSHDAFLKQLMTLLYSHTKGMIFVVYGVRWRDELIRYASDAGLHSLAVVRGSYVRGPLDIHFLNKENVELSEAYLQEVSEAQRKRGQKFPKVRVAIKPFATENGILLDPCSGLGGYAKVAADAGMRYFGNEMNPARYRRTVKAIENL